MPRKNKTIILLFVQLFLGAADAQNLDIGKQETAAVASLLSDVNLLQSQKPYPATQIRKKILAAVNKLKQVPIQADNLKQMQSYTAQVAIYLSHTGDGLEMEKLLQIHPELGQSENSDEAVNVTNCLCTFYEESNQEDKCAALISNLKKQPHPAAVKQIYILIRKNRLREALYNYPQVVLDMKAAWAIAEKSLPDRKPWITITLLSSALFSGKLNEAREHATEFQKDIARTNPNSIYRFYGGVLESAVLLSQEDYKKASDVVEKTRREILENVDGPISPLAWIDLHRLILAARNGNKKAAGEIMKDIDREAQVLPAEHYIPLIGRSIISYSENGDFGPSWQSALEVLGVKNPSINRIKTTIIQAIEPKKQSPAQKR